MQLALMITKNPTSFLSAGDGKQDRTRIDVASVNLLNRYMEGCASAEKRLLSAGFLAEEVDWREITKNPNVDLLRPNGEFIGIG